MSEKVRFSVTGLLLVLLLPYVMTIVVNGADVALISRQADIESVLPILVSAQISSDHEKETLKCQAVIARTNLYRNLMKKESLTEILSELKESMDLPSMIRYLMKDDYEKAVEETQGKILTLEGELKLTPYHEISAGRTRDGAEVFHDKAYEYLQPVDSRVDKKSPDYLNSTYISRQQLPVSLKITARDSSGYVTVLEADGDMLEGEAFCQGMGLSCSNFSMQELDGEIRFLCKGKGHGLGMSQYGANELAKSGSTYQEILKIYFPSMELDNFTERVSFL